MWIKEDFPPEIEQRRQIITPYLRAAYQGNPANPHGKISAYLKYDKLILNNQTYTQDNLDFMPQYMKDRMATSDHIILS